MFRFAALFLLSASLSAQLELGTHHWIKDPLIYPEDSFGRTCVLELSGDFRPDVLVRVGDKVMCCISPGVYESVVEVPLAQGTVVSDFCALPGGGPAGRDAFLLSSDGALESWWIDTTFGFAVVGSAAWAGAVELNAADVNGDGVPDALGVSADRESILRRYGPLETGDETSLDLNLTIHRMVPMEWDGTSGKELALLTSEGLTVIELDGTIRYHLDTDGDDSDRMCVVHVDGSPYERLTALLESPGDGYYLFTRDFTTTDTTTYLGPFEPVAISSGFRDDDGLQDVCISQSSTIHLPYFENTGPGAAFNASVYAMWDPDPLGADPILAPENQAHVILHDLDADGDGDVFFPLQRELAIAVKRNGLFQHSAQAPKVRSASYVYYDSSNSGVLTLNLDAPVSPPAENDVLLVDLWHQPFHHGMTTSHLQSYSYEWPLSPLSITLLLPNEVGDDLVHVEMRLGEYEGSELVSTAPTTVWSFTTHEPALVYLEDYGVTEFMSVPVEIVIEGGQAAGGGGWTAPMPCVPCLADEPIPRGRGN